jgi:hypothetical protein
MLSKCYRILLENITVNEVVNKSSTFYGDWGVHYHVYNTLPFVPALNQFNSPVYKPVDCMSHSVFFLYKQLIII